MTRSELRRLARIGAQARLDALQREVATIYAVFPDLRSGGSTPNPFSEGVRQAVQGAVTPRRPRLSLQARKRIAEAQRKRWAELKAKQANQADKAANTQPPSAGRSRKRKQNNVEAVKANR
jgi:hypothetical protein